MEKDTVETVTTHEKSVGQGGRMPDNGEASGFQTIEYLVYFIFGVIEILLAFRLMLRLLGANPTSDFVSLVYSLSAVFIWPFQGIFRSGIAGGIETTAVFEPATLIAIIFYAFLSWGVVMLIGIFSGRRQ